ncbi:hypothetical protein Patl1_10981 [Pistacia atlantica]|uniref:Uncharacterized protein n=1 Tax=Pistacia atlantica TaxID=434234 RepID=A0ACC1A9I0_9ROSI|nr:hypothetical protein Patl1_10981 [Pistacia atlantica]
MHRCKGLQSYWQTLTQASQLLSRKWVEVVVVAC